ncbi:unnamed protein product [Spirodela intermedia]|uniref:Uncharacterized protein n=1 Tax=Spirodela intermedia TaxID=51605 RepID=A0A7I8IUD0_SPIIN|nr:unnamed protein product [Spirodela intermedia]CAA6661428.1 unnamed protein product [Spirodela intermedia]
MIPWHLLTYKVFTFYYTFEEKPFAEFRISDQWILLHIWIIRDLWNMLVKYSSKRITKETRGSWCLLE